MTPAEILDYVRARLNESKGRWNSIAKEVGLPMSTVQSIAHGETRNPGILTVEKLAKYFREHSEGLPRLDQRDQPAA